MGNNYRSEYEISIEENKIYIDENEKCPLCGNNMQYQEITSSNSGAMTWCTNKDCDYRYNQFLDYEDFKKFEATIKIKIEK